MRSPLLLRYFPFYPHTTVVCGGGGLNKYQGHGADCLQRPLRSRFRQQLMPSVRLCVIVSQSEPAECIPSRCSLPCMWSVCVRPHPTAYAGESPCSRLCDDDSR